MTLVVDRFARQRVVHAAPNPSGVSAGRLPGGVPSCDSPDRRAPSESMSLSEIEKAVEQLPPADFARFTSWLGDLASERWDRQFEAPVAP